MRTEPEARPDWSVDQAFIDARDVAADYASYQQDPTAFLARLTQEHLEHLAAGSACKVIAINSRRQT